ncbi:hypothetical protein MKK68_19525 [Methylobacterium sp. E-016]|uniref:hypothetical protein n=1 Tax=Methylobacterium sp. E-016 TaxID=2836556 RepID=UPI001FB95600|nr:hypothetical protein [Methylobacterium sp. E-016]MCJ2077807.1 hypothetical protein [Methylobacterium sp. E-016]
MQTIETIIKDIDATSAALLVARERVDTARRSFLQAQAGFVSSGEAAADEGPSWRRQEDLGIALDRKRVRVLEMEHRLRDLDRDLRIERYAMNKGR